MKRNLSILACLVLTVAMVFALASCNLFDKPEEEHTHSFVEGECECGEKDPNYVPSHTHNYVDGKCECGEEDPNYVPPHEHSYVDGKCECGAEDPNYVPECTEHAFSVEVTKEASCTEAGEKTLTCTLCGHVETSEIAPEGHTEEKIPGTAPTCTEPGLSDGKKCSVCNEVTLPQSTINAAGHTFVEGKCACGEVDPDYNGPKTYVLDVQSLTSFAAGDKADGATESVADFFTIYYSAKTKIDSTKDKTWSDGYTFAEGLRLNWGGTTTIGETTKNAIEINVDGTATVKVWWICGGDGREIGIFDENGNIVVASQTDDVFTEGTEGVGAGKNGVYLSELTLDAAGKYFIGTDVTNAIKNGGNYICKVEVTVTPAEEEPAKEIKVETTDTYSWIDEYTFTADAEGYYTFTLPAGLGFWSVEAYNANKAPELDYNLESNGGDVVLGLEAGETVSFYVGAFTKDNWVITWSFVAGDVEDDVQDDVVETDTELEVGVNNIVVPGDSFGSAGEYTFVVETEGTYSFTSNDLMAIIVIDEYTSYRGSAYLTAGTYTVNVVYYTAEAGDYTLTVSYEAPVTGEPDGSEAYPYVWETLPESVVLDYSVISGKVYYTFTASVSGSITFTWPVEGDSWYDYFELDENGNLTSNSGSGFMADSHSFVIEAGKSYRVSLGSWAESGSHTIAISVTACDHVWSDATCETYSTCANCGATTGDLAAHTPGAEATCSAPQTCTVCGAELATANHSWVAGETVAASCITETNGTQAYTCSACGATKEDTIWWSHTWVEDELINETCTTDGYMKKHCSVCEKVVEETYDATGHYSYSLSCGESGECWGCGETFTKEHNTSWAPATCTTAAFCYNCYSYVGEALGHTPGAEATCTTAQICTVCEEVLASALGHTYVEEITTEATCTTEGLKTYTCSCGDSYTETIAALGHTYVEYVCSVCGADDPDHYFVMSITDALAAADGKKVQVSGTVSAINTAWSDSYGNISVTITDTDGNTLYIYRLKTNVALGDIITVQGAMGTYNGRQIAAGATATIDGHDDSYDYVEMTIEEAIAAADDTNVIVTGTVVKINTAYSSSYNNISVTISDDNGTQLYLYRLTGEVTVGQIIKVKGTMATYNSARQLTGGTFEVVGTHTCSTYTDATCTKLSACVVCGATTGELASHNYVDGTCSGCGAVEGVESATESLAIAASAGTLASDSLSISWTSDNFAVTCAKNDSTTPIRTSDGDHFRAYAGSLTTISGSNITKIVITCTGASYMNCSVQTSGVTMTTDGTTIILTVDSGTVSSIELYGNAQWRFSNVEVTYNK